MRISVKTKLFFAVLLVTILVITIIVAVTGWNLRQGFAAYVTKSELSRQDLLISRLETRYANEKSWDAFKNDSKLWTRLLDQSLHVEHSITRPVLSQHSTRLPLSARVLDIALPQASAQSPSYNNDKDYRPAAGDPQREPLAPPNAYRDCEGKREGELVMHRTREGLVEARCRYSPEGLVARPLRGSESNRQSPNRYQDSSRQYSSDTPQYAAPPIRNNPPDTLVTPNRTTGPGQNPPTSAGVQDKSPAPPAKVNIPPTATTTPTNPIAPIPPLDPFKLDTPKATTTVLSPPHTPTLAERLSLVDASGQLVAGRASLANDHLVWYPLKYGTQDIGRLGLLIPQQTSGLDKAFMDYSLYILMIASACALIISILAALILSKNFVGALQRLRLVTRQLAGGQYQARLTEQRNDELGDLMKDFNRLAVALEQHEESRRTWVAQTSHELRTPVSVLRAHIEALIDGVRASSKPELEVLHKEVMRLGKLITDLNDLARADSGALAFRKEPVELIALVDEMLSTFKDRFKSHSLAVEFKRNGRALVFADEDRIRQLLANLFENSLRYTDAPGQLRITYEIENGRVELCIEDSAPGVSTSGLADLFNPFFRTDESRRRTTGGSGLGLAICRSIVLAHEGSLHAEHSQLGGLKTLLSLPLMEA